uniref:Branchpoint-bridging protein n=2 Tax=Anopheles atroparvus TaxID=41427 RepID=A0A182JAJ5_ANOAO
MESFRICASSSTTHGADGKERQADRMAGSAKERHRSRSRERSSDRAREGRRSKDRRRHSRPREESRERDHRRREREHHERRSRSRSRDRKHRSHEKERHRSREHHGTESSRMAERPRDNALGTVAQTNGNSSGGEGEAARKRKRKSRWAGGDHDKTFIPGMPTVLPSTLTPDQQEAYLVQLQIEEITRKLRTGDLMIPQNLEERHPPANLVHMCGSPYGNEFALPATRIVLRRHVARPSVLRSLETFDYYVNERDWSPSPEPIYSSDGKRLNTREFRTRKKLEEQRHQLIQRMQSLNPDFKPPSDYKPPVIRVSDKVLIPQEEHPDINFVGLLIGPRGNTLKAMEKDTGAKIIIRGKGSVKEGKVGRKDGQPLPGEDEPLHAFITASNPEAVKKAVDRIKDVIRQGIEVPEGHNDLRRMQLRELAQLNGTLRETDGPRCNNCGSNEHKSWLCPDKPNITNNIVCSACGGTGHIARDCRSKRPGHGGPPGSGSNVATKIDEEYMSLMAELGEAPPQHHDHGHGHGGGGGGGGYRHDGGGGGGGGSRGSYNLFESRSAPRPLMSTAHHPPSLMGNSHSGGGHGHGSSSSSSSSYNSGANHASGNGGGGGSGGGGSGGGSSNHQWSHHHHSSAPMMPIPPALPTPPPPPPGMPSLMQWAPQPPIPAGSPGDGSSIPAPPAPYWQSKGGGGGDGGSPWPPQGNGGYIPPPPGPQPPPPPLPGVSSHILAPPPPPPPSS